MKISPRCLADYVKTLHQKAIIFLHSTNQIIDLWRYRWRCRRRILSSLIIKWVQLIFNSCIELKLLRTILSCCSSVLGVRRYLKMERPKTSQTHPKPTQYDPKPLTRLKETKPPTKITMNYEMVVLRCVTMLLDGFGFLTAQWCIRF